ncbi:MAG: glyoxalase [Gemmatimonas sp.]|nr:glyoxalase [Gemmatimonas sp.]
MTSGSKILVVPVKNLDRAKSVYRELLGVDPYTDEPYYVGFRVGEQEIGLDPNGHAQGMTSPVAYWQVDDINRSFEQLVEAGADAQQAIKDVGGGRRIAILRDPDGNAIGLVQD